MHIFKFCAKEDVKASKTLLNEKKKVLEVGMFTRNLYS